MLKQHFFGKWDVSPFPNAPWCMEYVFPYMISVKNGHMNEENWRLVNIRHWTFSNKYTCKYWKELIHTGILVVYESLWHGKKHLLRVRYFGPPKICVKNNKNRGVFGCRHRDCPILFTPGVAVCLADLRREVAKLRSRCFFFRDFLAFPDAQCMAYLPTFAIFLPWKTAKFEVHIYHAWSVWDCDFHTQKKSKL